MHITRISLLLAFAAGCGGAAASLVDLDVVSPGEDCAHGGVVIKSGTDTNGDGTLQDDEVTSSESVCDGAEPSSALLASTVLEPGDAACPGGGVKFESGLDDGDPGGVADDGVLQPEEVDSTEYLCDSPFAEDQQPFVPFDPPAGPAGQYTVTSVGGRGRNGSGGDGGYVELEMEYGSIGGGIRVYATGQADASWDYPATVSYDLGDVPLEVTTNTTIPVVGTTEGLATGALYLLREDTRLRRWNGTSGETITGVSVAAGATLTIEPNLGFVLSLGEPLPGTRAQIELDSDFHLAGTLTTTFSGPNRADLRIDCDVFVGEATGSVALTGQDVPGGNGGDGGRFEVSADDSDLSVSQSNGAIFNQATIDSSGGSGATGGNAGAIDLYASLHLYNTADVTAVGGDGSDGDAGSGGDIDLRNDYAHNYNSGTLNASGGDATDGDGGGAGRIYFYNGYYGNVYNTGDLLGEGGDATNCTYDCSAGDGSYVEWIVYANPIISSGDISTKGGNATLASGTTLQRGPYGGDGGYVYAESDYESGWSEADVVPVGDMVFSGNWVLSGGEGGEGGEGGYVDLEMDCDYAPNNQVIAFLGYTAFDLRGGDGTTSGGDGGTVWMNPDYADSDTDFDYGSGGPVINHANWNLNGGNGGSASGGNGGWFELLTDYDYSWDAPWTQTLNFGDVTARGGNGYSGGDGGAAYLFGYRGVENHGDLTCDGGNAMGVEGSGGDGGDNYDEYDQGIYLLADYGNVLNTGNLSAKGGNASGEFGEAGDSRIVEIVGMKVTNSGAIYATGGTATGTDSVGGDSEGVFLHSMYDTTEQTGTVIEVAGGTGTSATGDHGLIFIDGQNVTNDY